MQRRKPTLDEIKKLEDAGMLNDKASKIARKAAREGIGSLTNAEQVTYEDAVESRIRDLDQKERQ
jgi:hypothetical protein